MRTTKINFILTMTLLAVTLNAIDLVTVYNDLKNNNDNYQESCLALANTKEFCDFTVALVFLDLLMTDIKERDGYITENTTIKLINKFVCPSYRRLSGADRLLIKTITTAGEPHMEDKFWHDLCY